MNLRKFDIEDLANTALREIRALTFKNTPAIRTIRSKLSKRLRAENAANVVAVGEALIARGLRWVGYEIITKHGEARSSLGIGRVESLGKGMDSWGAVDAFAVYISGPAWRDDQIATADVVRWARSENLWWRRAALVSTVPLNTKTTGGDSARTFAIASLLLDDREDLVAKALSWSLRSLAPLQPKAVQEFLSRHDSRLAARVKREVASKLKTGLKQKRSARQSR